MPYDRPSTYLTWGGRIGSDVVTPEVWQCGLKLAEVSDTEVLGLWTVENLEDFYGLAEEMHTSPTVEIWRGCYLEWVKAASLDTNGEYLEPPTVYEGGAVAGGSARPSTGASPQDSAAVTLWSGSTFGRANYGRFYLPWNDLAVGLDGFLATVDVEAAVADVKTFIDGVNTLGATIPGPDQIVHIMSSVGTGISKPAVQIRIGNVKDTQRRRRNRLPETYSTAAIA